MGDWRVRRMRMKEETLAFIYGADTTPEAAVVQRALLRKMSYAQRWEQLENMIETTRALMVAGLCQRYPEESPERTCRRELKCYLKMKSFCK